MRLNHRILLFVAVCFVLNFAGLPVIAQVSLLPEHSLSIDDVTLLRDYKNPLRWYYVSAGPQLLEKDPENFTDPRPAFQFMTYQAKKDDVMFEGGVIQFSVSLKLSSVKQKKLLSKLRKIMKISYNDSVELVPLPFRQANATIYDAEGSSLARVPQSPGLSPPYITGALPFQLKLNRFGADLYAALTTEGNTGIGVLMELSFDGMLPPAGFKVNLDYDQTWKFLKESKNIQVQLGNWFVGAGVGYDKSKIREEMLSNRCLTVESLTNEKVDHKLLDKYLDPVLKKVCEEMFTKIEPPPMIDNSASGKPGLLENCFFLGKVSVKTELKDISVTRKGSHTFDFNTSVMVERKTACGSFIGINKYSEELKKQLVSTMPLNNWASAYLLLPEISNSPELNLIGVSMSANVVDSKNKPISGLSDTASWNHNSPNSWKNNQGTNTYNLKFPLMSLFEKQNNDIAAIRQEYKFEIAVKIEQMIDRKLNSMSITYYAPVFNGDLPLADPVNLVDNLIFDLSMLDFSSEGLKKVQINVNKGKIELSRNVTMKKPESKTIVFILPSESSNANEITAEISFEKSGSRERIAWENNHKNLKEVEPSLYFILFDSDWQK